MMIIDILERKFNAKDVQLEVKLNGNSFYRSIDVDFDDAVEIKVTHSGSVYIRMSIEGVDVDTEIDGISDNYILRGNFGRNKLGF